MRHRRDIDGLRAVAVVPVVLFHAGVSQVSGGFVGVDIFFVISGYLITALIVGELREGRFSLATFYERRIRRIFPALFAVLAACMILALILFMPLDLMRFSRSLVPTAFFVSNIFFYRGSGYFVASPDTLPLLHTWSLAIEEQFYIVFPVALLFAFRWGGQRWIWLVFIAFVLSLAASIWVTAVNPDAAFFLAPMRVWELMLGALLASGVLPRIKSQVLREVAAFLGLGLIAYAVFSFSNATPFPGASALVPCLGAALLIYAGEEAGTSIVSRALSLWPVVFVGLISYSLYLWHWPLLVFARYWNITMLTGWQSSAIVIASFVLAAFSWAYIEQPFRRKQTRISRGIVFAGAAAVMGFIFSVGALDLARKGFPERFSPEVIAVARNTKSVAGEGLLDACKGKPGKVACILGAPVSPSYAVWGDSHARVMAAAIASLAEQYGKSVQLFANTGCPPVIDLVGSGRRFNQKCALKNTKTMQALESSPTIDTVILISRYAAYINGIVEPRIGAAYGSGLILGVAGEALDPQAAAAIFERQLDVTVSRLLAAGKTVVLVYPVPEMGFSVPSAVSRMLARGGDPQSLNLPLASFMKRQDVVLSALDRAGNSQRIFRVYPHKRLCSASECLVYVAERSLYLDDDHLSIAGMDLVLPEFAPIFAGHGAPTAAADLTSALPANRASAQQ